MQYYSVRVNMNYKRFMEDMRRFFFTGEPTKDVGVSHVDGGRCNAVEIVGERNGGGDEISLL